MQPTGYPLWKSAAWTVGILVYFAAATALILFVVGADPIHAQVRGLLGDWGALIADCLLWVTFFALAAWQLFARAHKTAGWILTALTVVVALLSILFLFFAAVIS